MYIYHNRTQELANLLPEHYYGRQYKYSVYQQILNMYSNQFSDLKFVLRKATSDLFVQTNKLDSIDVVYIHPIPSADILSVHDKDLNTEITESQFSDVDSWWYKTNPTHAEKKQIPYEFIDLLNDVVPENTISIEHDFTVPVNLYISLKIKEDIESAHFMQTNPNLAFDTTTVSVHGLNKYKEYVVEEHIFFSEATYASEHEWLSIEKVECDLFDDMNKFELSLGTSCVNYDIAMATKVDAENETYPEFYSLTEGILEYKKLVPQSLENMNAGFIAYDIDKAFKLFDTNGVEITPVSLIYDDYRKLMYMSDESKIYAFYNEEEYPVEVKKATALRTPNPLVSININKVETGLVEFKGIYSRTRISDTIEKYRIVVYDGNSTYSYNGTEFVSGDTTWVNYELKGTIGFKTENYSYGNGIDYFTNNLIIRFDVFTNNGITETDTYIIEKQIKNSVFDIAMSLNEPKFRLGLHGELQVEVYNSVEDTKELYEINFINTTYIKDVDNGLIVFAHGFTNPTMNGVEITLTASNVENELDSIAAPHHVRRFDGEKNRDFIHRLIKAFHVERSSTHVGLINAIAIDLGQHVKDALRFSHVDGVCMIDLKFPYLYLKTGATETPSVVSLLELSTIGGLVVSMPSGYTCTILDECLLNYPITSLIEESSYKYASDSKIGNRKKNVILEPKYSKGIAYDTIRIKNFTKVADNNELLSTETPAFYVDSNNVIRTNKELIVYDTIFFLEYSLSPVLKMSPIITSSPGLIYSRATDSDKKKIMDSKYMKSVLHEANKINPFYWR